MAIAFLFASVVLVAGVGFYITVGGVRVTGRDVAWLSSTAHTPPAEAAVYGRYLDVTGGTGWLAVLPARSSRYWSAFATTGR